MRASTERFTYDAGDRTFSAEASDLGENQPQFHQAYPDSCDEGMTLVSHKTGKEVDFVVTHTEVEEGDLKYWRLEPTKQALRRVPEARGTKIILFND